jgi:hypothetical protein
MIFKHKILIGIKNPNDINPEEAEILADSIRVEFPNYKVKVENQKYASYGVTWYEILLIYVLSKVTNKVIEDLTHIAIEWARKRFKNKKNNRPTYIKIYGPNNQVLKSVVLKNATVEPEDTTKEDRELER